MERRCKMAEGKQDIRQSNMELLRIICMAIIIVFHILTQTKAGSLSIETGINYILVIISGFGGRLVCNCFVMIGAWFLTESNFKAERILKLWLEVYFYAVLITILCMILNVGNANIVTLVQAFFPIYGRPVWFAAEYMCMLILSPFMNKLLETNHEICKKLLIIFGVLIIGCATMFPIEHTTPAFSELVWFCFLYLLIGYWKKFPIYFCQKKGLCWILFGITYLVQCVLYIMCVNCGVVQLRTIANYYMHHYETLLAFLSSIFLFYAMKNTHISYNRVINTIARSAFAVYLIHQIPAFYPFLWNGIFQVDSHVYEEYFFLYIIGIEILLFVFGVISEKIRSCFFSYFVYNCITYERVVNFLGKYIDIKE